MKKYIVNLIIILLMSWIPGLIRAGTQSSYTITVYKTSKQSEHNPPPVPEGRRMPPAPLICNISLVEGLNIIGLEEQILSYEVWDVESDECLVCFVDEVNFLTYLYSQHGAFQIKLNTEEYAITGCVVME